MVGLVENSLQLVHKRRNVHASAFPSEDGLLHGEQGCCEGVDTESCEFTTRLEPFPCRGYFDTEAMDWKVGGYPRGQGRDTWRYAGWSATLVA